MWWFSVVQLSVLVLIHAQPDGPDAGNIMSEIKDEVHSTLSFGHPSDHLTKERGQNFTLNCGNYSTSYFGFVRQVTRTSTRQSWDTLFVGSKRFKAKARHHAVVENGEIVYSVSDLNQGDSGFYRCRQGGKQVFLSVTLPIRSLSRKEGLALGREVSPADLEPFCRFQSNPEASIKYYKNGIPLNGSEKVSLSDSLFCNATNPMTRVSASHTLAFTVAYPPTKLSPGQDGLVKSFHTKQGSQEYSEVTLNCTVDAMPAATAYRWSHYKPSKSKLANRNEWVDLDNEEPIYKVTRKASDDFNGDVIFVCCAFNPHGNLTLETRVKFPQLNRATMQQFLVVVVILVVLMFTCSTVAALLWRQGQKQEAKRTAKAKVTSCQGTETSATGKYRPGHDDNNNVYENVYDNTQKDVDEEV